MSASGMFILRKKERLCSRRLIEQLFGGGGSRSMSSFPLRVVYMPLERTEGMAPVSILVSVPKRHLKRAVDRNRVKRQVREAYRLQKLPLCEAVLRQENKALALAFIWMEGSLRDSHEVHRRVGQLLRRIEETL